MTTRDLAARKTLIAICLATFALISPLQYSGLEFAGTDLEQPVQEDEKSGCEEVVTAQSSDRAQKRRRIAMNFFCDGKCSANPASQQCFPDRTFYVDGHVLANGLRAPLLI